jgi:CDP-diacylglycerol--glycerol-3-phosphate 3-phosphatidyltransferase
MHKANPLPNILTWIRIVSGVLMFGCLGGAVGVIPFLDPEVDLQFKLATAAFVIFVAGAVTDFFDGWLARKLNAVTEWGATLDPIADKILVCGTILGLASIGPNPHIAVPGALILFREFVVSALREGVASRGGKLKVTTLAKWKTTVQLVALGLELFNYTWSTGAWLPEPEIQAYLKTVADTLMWVAAAVTLYTGWDYVQGARRAIPHEAAD